ncbi:hypothetical protein J6590_031786 [Homalodisca vitripennis]|nr:hypothetical protein J6590_031786 [Homalodisca vitripennis]
MNNAVGVHLLIQLSCPVWGLPGGTTLLQYIRDVAQLKGTKYMCREGGCGSCIVNLTFTDPVTGLDKSFGINSEYLVLRSQVVNNEHLRLRKTWLMAAFKSRCWRQAYNQMSLVVLEQNCTINGRALSTLRLGLCLYALYSCQGMSVTTIEGIGSKQKGYDPVQCRLANFYGTQCGYCSTGWVMAMYR